MPYFGLLPFLRTRREFIGSLLSSVSMPYFGLLPFLLTMSLVQIVRRHSCFNALLRASSFSTGGRKWRKTWTRKCFNALLRASSFSTLPLMKLKLLLPNCFNALLRASSFSTSIIKGGIVTVKHVSMPYFGLLPFLHYVSTAIDFTGFPASIL